MAGGAPSEIVDAVGVPFELADQFAGVRVPDEYEAVLGGGGDESTVGGEGERADLFVMAVKNANELAGLRIPEANFVIVVPGGDLARVGAEHQRGHPGGIFVPAE